jgi:hypothetical protein
VLANLAGAALVAGQAGACRRRLAGGDRAVDHWVNLMITVMARREFRDAAGLLPEISDAAAQLGDSVRRAHWLPGPAQVLDDEPLVVLDSATGRGFRLTMSGIGDNFQLHRPSLAGQI